jgi:PAS domain S-box-containing protein
MPESSNAHLSDRKRAEEELLASVEQLRLITDSVPAAIAHCGRDGRYKFVNQPYAARFGMQRDEVIGRHISEVAGADSYESVRVYIERALRGEAVEFEMEIPYEVWGTHYMACAYAPERDQSGEVVGFVAVVMDITDRKRAESELRLATEQAEKSALAETESTERFRLVSEIVSIQVWTARGDGQLDFVNPECAAYLGSDNIERDILGNAWARHVHPEDLPGALNAWQKCLISLEPYEVEFRLRNVSGEYRWFLVRAQAMRNNSDGQPKWFGTNTDIHDLKVAQNEAERASRLKDQFLATLSHELRTPLTPALMTAAALSRDESLPVSVRQQLSMMERNIALEARLIDDLLDLTRITRGKLDFRGQKCDTHSLIGLAIEIVSDDAMTKGISIQRDFAAQQAGLHADPARFQQVMWNILRNAVKFTPRGGNVIVKTRNENGASGSSTLRIEVTDSGIGIDSSQLETIFQPFEQGGLSGNHQFGGIGLGLAIARAIVEMHGGRIQARSEGKDRGAIFIVEFPEAMEPPGGAIESADSIARSLSGAPGVSKPANLRLLLVEDHKATAQVLSQLLERAGHQVFAVSNIADALDAVAANPFDIVVSDLGLPDGSGNDLMRKLRDAYGLRGIALSGYGMDEDIARSHEAGFVAHLIKPVDFHQLERALRLH